MLGLHKYFIIKGELGVIINKNLDEVNVVKDSDHKITAFGFFWWLKKFLERLGVGPVFTHDYGIKNRSRGFGERDYFLSVLYLLMSVGKSRSVSRKIRSASISPLAIINLQPDRIPARKPRKNQPNHISQTKIPGKGLIFPLRKNLSHISINLTIQLVKY